MSRMNWIYFKGDEMSHKYGETRVFTDEGYKHTVNKDGTKYLEESLTEKLGITPIQSHRFYADVHAKTSEPYCKTEEVRKVEQQNADMLEALIELALIFGNMTDEEAGDLLGPTVTIIGKTTGKTWQEIKDLFNA